MKPRFIAIIAILMSICGILILLSGMNKDVTMVINGQSQTISTSATKVGNFLHQAQIETGDGDILYPPSDHWITTGEIITIKRAALVHVQVGEEEITFKTTQRIPANILSEANIPLFPGDLILTNGLPIAAYEILPPLETYSIQLVRALPVTIRESQSYTTIFTSDPTLGQALWESGKRFYAKDLIDPEILTPVDEPLLVEIKPSQVIDVRVSGRNAKEHTNTNTVGEALVDVGYPLQGLDYSVPPEGTRLRVDEQIRTVKVREEVIIKSTPIPFDTQYQPDPGLVIDNQEIIQPGESGWIAQGVRILYEDGIEISRTVEAEYIAKNPAPRIIGYGTNIEPRTINTPQGPKQYWRALNMYAVSYHPSSAGGSTTATGQTLKKGVVAIDPRYIPYGTRLYIPGYGEGIAADTGPGLTPRMIDLGYSDEDYVSWHQNVTVYFLWPPPDNIVWIIP
jgi:uncharacterized protein YabE (DUF348 family)